MRRTRSWRTTSASAKRTWPMPSSPTSSSTASAQAGHLTRRQIGLRRIAGDDHARALAEPGQEHLHLHRGRVLRLVQQDAGIGQVRPRMKASGATSIMPVCMPRSTMRGVHEIVQGIEDRAQIGIDLLAHVAGQEAEPLARLDRRPRQDQPLDVRPARAARRHSRPRARSCPCRPDLRRNELVPLQARGYKDPAPHCGRARRRAGACRSARNARGRDLGLGNSLPCSAPSWIAPSTSPSADRLAELDARIERFEHVAGLLAGFRRSLDRHVIAVAHWRRRRAGVRPWRDSGRRWPKSSEACWLSSKARVISAAPSPAISGPREGTQAVGIARAAMQRTVRCVSKPHSCVPSAAKPPE